MAQARSARAINRWEKTRSVILQYGPKTRLIRGIHAYNTRSANKVYIKYERTNYRRSSVDYRGAMIWNSLPNSLKEIKGTQSADAHAHKLPFLSWFACHKTRVNRK